MKKMIIAIIICIFIFGCLFVSSETSMNFLTKGYADTLYCRLYGTCDIDTLSVGNLTVWGDYMNVTVTDYNVTNSMIISKNLTVDSPTFHVDSNTRRVGIGTLNPDTKLHMVGTTANDIIRVDIGLDFNPVIKPSSPAITLLTGAGNIDGGRHYYYITYYTALGETEVRPSTPTYIIANNTHAQVNITLPVSDDYRVIGRKIYRTINSSGTSYWSNARLVTTIENNTATSYTDNKADASLTGTNYYFRANTVSKFIMVNGVQSMFLSTTDVLLGYNAGRGVLNNNGSNANVMIGEGAGRSVTTSAKNVLIGVGAGRDMTSGDSQVAIGHAALNQVTSGGGNIGIGRNAGYYNEEGYQNTVIGGAALFGSSGQSYGYNTVVGYLSGNLVTNGSNNVLLGYKSGYSIGSGSDNVFLGYQSGYYETGSDKLFIDNDARANESDARTKALIYGVFDADPANQYLTFNSNVDINSRLHITSDTIRQITINASGGGQSGIDIKSGGTHVRLITDAGSELFRLFDQGDSKNRFVIKETTGDTYLTPTEGNVGIGTITPREKLDVNGSIVADGNLTVTGGITAPNITLPKSTIKSTTKNIEFTSYNKTLRIDLGDDWKWGVTWDVVDHQGSGSIIRWDEDFMMNTGKSFFLSDNSDMGLYGSGPDSNESFVFFTRTGGKDDKTGHFVFVNTDDRSHANRNPTIDAINPTIRIYANGTAQSWDYMDLSHNGESGIINVTSLGELIIDSSEVDVTNLVVDDLIVAKRIEGLTRLDVDGDITANTLATPGEVFYADSGQVVIGTIPLILDESSIEEASGKLLLNDDVNITGDLYVAESGGYVYTTGIITSGESSMNTIVGLTELDVDGIVDAEGFYYGVDGEFDVSSPGITIYGFPYFKVAGTNMTIDDGGDLRIIEGGRVGIGTTTPNEELTVVGDVNITGNLTSKIIYAQLSDLQDQTFAATGTKQAINLTTTDGFYGLGISESNITIQLGGVYDIAAQPQVTAGPGDAGNFHMWLEKHNTTQWINVSNSNVELTLDSNDEDVIPLLVTLRLEAGEKIRIMGSVSDTGIKLDAKTVTGEPNIPSIICRLFRLGN